MRARLKVSRAGVELIKSFEGLRQTAARLPDGRWTLGYGHTFSARDGARVTPEDAEALLRFDLLPIVDGLNNNIVVPLSQHQFDALVSFCFNIGLENFVSSNVLKRINEGRLMEAALAMESWRSAEFGGQTYVLAPLIRRRAAEKNLFLTPVESDNTAPSMLVRPMEDPRMGQSNPSRPAELDAPLYGDHLQARPLGEPEAAPAYPSAYATPVYEAPVQAAPVAPVTPVPSYGSDRSYIDLSASPIAPQAEMLRAKPVIVRVADLGPETPAVAPAPIATAGFAPSSFQTDAEPVMSPQVRAALEQAQAEADARGRAEEQRRADEARMAEETRLRETRLAEEAQRQAQALAAARAEQDARQAAFKLEEDRRLEEEQRQRAARLEEEKARQAQAEEALRLEAQRQEDQRRETEAREAEARRFAEAQKQAERAAAVVPAETPSPADAPKPETPAAPAGNEETKRNEAMASLMRFYSPYGASPMGKPLGSLRPTPAATPAPTQAPTTQASTPAPAPVAIPAATQASPSLVVAPPSVAETVAAPAPVMAKPVYPAYPPSKPAETSVAAAPGLMIDTQEPTILSPSALVPPAVFAANPQAAPRPSDTPLEIGRSNPARQAAAEAQVSWRDKLDRPLPGEFPKAAAQAAPHHSPSKIYDATVSDDDELWDDEHARIAMMADDHEDDHPSFLSMVSSSIGWLITSTLGIVALGGAAASFYKQNDPVVVRDGDWADFFNHLTIILAGLGLVLICFSIGMILKRLGGLKD